MVSPDFAPDDPAAAEVDERSPAAVCDRLGVSVTEWLAAQSEGKTVEQFEEAVIAKRAAQATTPAAEDDAQPPADDPARGFDIPESLRERMIPANPADLAGVRFQVPPFLTFDGDDQRVLLTIGAQLHAIAGRPGGPDLPTCRRYTVKMYESTGREWHDSGGVLVPVGVTIESAA